MDEQPGEPQWARRDPGLQPERTALAWQRTALSIAAAVLIVVRLTVGSVGALAVVVLVFCLGHAVVLLHSSRRRYDARTGAVARQPWSVGVHGALLAVQVLLLAALELAALAIASTH
jgi:putative membrane protein